MSMMPASTPYARMTTVALFLDASSLTLHFAVTDLAEDSSPPHRLNVDTPRDLDHGERARLEMRLGRQPSTTDLVDRDARSRRVMNSPVALRTSVAARKSSASRLVRKPRLSVCVRSGMRYRTLYRLPPAVS
jgi:hypothetical protein